MERYKLLIVDDEEKILKALGRVFLDEEYDITTASGGEEALATLQNGAPPLVISDQMMPGMNGIDLLGRIKEQSPDTLGILLTGQGDIRVAVDAINSGVVYKYLPKPWDDEQLIRFLAGLQHRETSKHAIKVKTAGLKDRMVLARDIISKGNMLLVARGEKLKKSYLEKISFYVDKGLVEDEFYVLEPSNGDGDSAKASPKQAGAAPTQG